MESHEKKSEGIEILKGIEYIYIILYIIYYILYIYGPGQIN